MYRILPSDLRRKYVYKVLVYIYVSEEIPSDYFAFFFLFFLFFLLSFFLLFLFLLSFSLSMMSPMRPPIGEFPKAW